MILTILTRTRTRSSRREDPKKGSIYTAVYEERKVYTESDENEA